LVRTVNQEASMRKLSGSTSAAVVVTALLLALSGCQKQEGPAEKAGREIDKAGEKLGEQVEKAGEKMQDAARRDKK
jgi:hypothetical protein